MPSPHQPVHLQLRDAVLARTARPLSEGSGATGDGGDDLDPISPHHDRVLVAHGASSPDGFAVSAFPPDLWTRTTNSTQEFWTRPDVPGKKLADKPVFVLTSRRTFSLR